MPRRKRKRLHSQADYPFGRSPASNRPRRRRKAKAARELRATARKLGF